MVSGIGPEATLKSLNIPVVANLPGVGQNFYVRFSCSNLVFFEIMVTVSAAIGIVSTNHISYTSVSNDIFCPA